jgi:hypothetical protein
LGEDGHNEHHLLAGELLVCCKDLILGRIGQSVDEQAAPQLGCSRCAAK